MVRSHESRCSSYAPVSLGLRPFTCDVTVDVCRVFLQEQYPAFLMQDMKEIDVLIRVHDVIVADRRSREQK